MLAGCACAGSGRRCSAMATSEAEGERQIERARPRPARGRRAASAPAGGGLGAAGARRPRATRASLALTSRAPLSTHRFEYAVRGVGPPQRHPLFLAVGDRLVPPSPLWPSFKHDVRGVDSLQTLQLPQITMSMQRPKYATPNRNQQTQPSALSTRSAASTRRSAAASRCRRGSARSSPGSRIPPTTWGRPPGSTRRQ